MNQEKLEVNSTNTIDCTNKKAKKTKKILLIILAIILISVVILIILYTIDINRMRNNEPVLFSTWGYSYVPPIDLKEEEINIAIMDYLVDRSDNEYKHHGNEKTFASMRVYLIEEKERHAYYNIYAWVLEEKYYLENSEIKKESGSSIPYMFVVENINGKFTVTDSKIPRDGSYYAEDMKNIFPSSVRNDMEEVYTDGTIERLELDIEEQAELYF